MIYVFKNLLAANHVKQIPIKSKFINSTFKYK